MTTGLSWKILGWIAGALAVPFFVLAIGGLRYGETPEMLGVVVGLIIAGGGWAIASALCFAIGKWNRVR